MLTDDERDEFGLAVFRATWLRDDRGYLREWARFVVSLVLMLVGFGVFAVVGNAISWHARHVSCAQLQAQSGYDTRMVGSWFAGDCYVRVGDRWIPDTRYRLVEDAG